MTRTDWWPMLEPWLRQLGTAAAVSQVRVFANDPRPPGEPLTGSLCAQWTTPDATGWPREQLQHVPFVASGCGRWETVMALGDAIIGNTSEMPESEQPILKSQGVVAMAIVPVFVRATWWGFIGFSDCFQERTWTPSELHALYAAAQIFGAALAHRAMEEQIAKSTTQELLAAEIGDLITTGTHNLDDVLQRCSLLIAHHLRADIVRVYNIDRRGARLHASESHSSLVTLLPSDVAVGELGVGRVASTKTTQVWSGTLPELWPGSLPVTESLQLHSAAAYPLLTDNEVVGVVVMANRTELSADALEGLFSVTDELALAIERSRVKLALHLTEDRYQRLVEATVEGICIHDGKRIHDSNPSLAHMLGYAGPADVLGRSPLEFIHPDSLEHVKRNLAINYTQAYEAIMVRKDGSAFNVEIKGRDFVLDGENLRVATVRDMTERKEAELVARKLLEEQTAHELSERNRMQAEFLADASRILASSFDTTTTLNQLAHLSVRSLADFCVVSVFAGDAFQRVAIVHGNPDRQEYLEKALTRWDAEWRDTNFLIAKQKMGKSFVVQCSSDAELAWFAPQAELQAILRELGTISLMSVPLLGGGEVTGAMLFSASAPRGAATDRDL
ncbi:MAG TPA: GAF domain-containing protein, partial [Longimicrobiales bacterium]|nr:GAF domain-containing protein [Longimicrobiales bacterium]